MSPEELFASCKYQINWKVPRKTSDIYHELANYIEAHQLEPDVYGHGKFKEQFETEIAELLGLEYGLFMPSGVMAQQIALRIWTDQLENKNVCFHKSSHLELNEHKAYQHLHGLKAHLIKEDTPIFASHIETLPVKPGAVLTEIPMRNYGGLAPSWDELEELKDYAKQNSIKLHMDGARLWECKTFYNKPYSQICRGFDSVYVSFYKGINGLCGSMLLGDKEFIEQARIWLRRMGGDLFQLFPYIVSAKLNFDKYIDGFQKLKVKTLEIARIFSDLKKISIHPNPPQVNMFHLHFKTSAEKVLKARDQIAREDKIWLFGKCTDLEEKKISKTEIYIGASANSIDSEFIHKSFQKLDHLL